MQNPGRIAVVFVGRHDAVVAVASLEDNHAESYAGKWVTL